MDNCIRGVTCWCGSGNLKRSGVRNGEQEYKCKECDSRFTRSTRYNNLAGTSLTRRIKVSERNDFNR